MTKINRRNNKIYSVCVLMKIHDCTEKKLKPIIFLKGVPFINNLINTIKYQSKYKQLLPLLYYLSFLRNVNKLF